MRLLISIACQWDTADKATARLLQCSNLYAETSMYSRTTQVARFQRQAHKRAEADESLKFLPRKGSLPRF
jgi:hypothetical protein